MRAARARGFSLLELMISMAVTVIILFAVTASFIAVQGVYQREAQLKTAVENGRVAMAYIERVTKFIGYGIDPRFAIDLGIANLPNTNKTNEPSTADTSTSTYSVITDDFAFRYRDPSYLRRGSYDTSTNTVTLLGTGGSPTTLGVALQPGRLIQLVCTAGQAWVVLKVTGSVTATTASTVSVASANVAGNDTSFPAPGGEACLNFGGANAPYVMLVREVRLRVMPLGTSPNRRAFLVAYNSLAPGTTVADFDPIAADVESFQVSYLMNRGTGTPSDKAGGDWIIGNGLPTGEISLPTANAAGPTYEVPYGDAARFNSDVGNVRGVVFDISTRSFRAEPRKAFPRTRLADDTTTVVAADGYFHLTLSTTVRTPNMASRTTFTPPLRVAGDPSQLNDWGG